MRSAWVIVRSIQLVRQLSFGYPRAHKDDAERAVRAGLGRWACSQALMRYCLASRRNCISPVGTLHSAFSGSTSGILCGSAPTHHLYRRESLRIQVKIIFGLEIATWIEALAVEAEKRPTEKSRAAW